MKPKSEEPHSISNKISFLEMLVRKEKNTSNNHKELLKLTKQIDNLKLKLDKLSNGVCISDHALVRYLDRGMGIDVEGVRDDLLKKVKDIHMGDGKYILTDGLYAIIKNGVVATVLDENVDYKSGGRK